MKLIVLVLFFVSLSASKPELFLLNKYTPDMNVLGWFMSEKLDGVRAYWNGKNLISRNGKVFTTPKYFTKDFPLTELDGELWSKRGDFSNISSIVNTNKVDERWKTLTYNVFEVPNAKGTLQERLSLVKESRHIKILKQIKIKTSKDLDLFLKGVERKGGEGVVVRNGELSYYSGRNSNALKLKSYVDEECKVVGYTEGHGKFKYLLGALLCNLKNDKIIKIGTGFTNEERTHPPKIGAIITFKYYGLTSKGNPRFPVYLRERK
ncbi:DNA ligase (ATP) [hydrothermal vent metagenome]|uniref:DNA ligase (ATP) n=1 Tax=hydrothermal vent metagenome TaxID=652676 RepID=A0A1W1BF29_9ZZZZ